LNKNLNAEILKQNLNSRFFIDKKNINELNINNSKLISESKNDSITETTANSNISIKSEPIINKISTAKINPSSFSDLIPLKNEMNCDAPFIPSDFFKLVNLNDFSNQNNIGNIECLNMFKKTIFSNDHTCYLKLRGPPHIYL